MKRFRFGVLLVFAASLPAPAQTVAPAGDDTILKQITIFGRHGVRSATTAPSDYARFTPRPLPDFGVPPGYLTPHGQQAELLLGSYFRDYLLHERLLTGNVQADADHSYFRSNSIQRSNITAGALGNALFPGVTVPVHSYPLGTPDPVFDPILANVVTVDPARAAAEVQKLYNSGGALASAYSAEFSLLRGLMFNYQNGTQPAPPTPPGFVDPSSQPIPLTANTTNLATGFVVDLGGATNANAAADPFVMEYATGLPMKDVAWGQLSVEGVSQQSRLLKPVFDIELRSPYLNQVQSSNAASHVLRSMEQAVIGDSIPGAFGDAATRVNVIISSDGYVAGLAGMLDLHWLLPGYQPDFCAPGGALVFELRQSKKTGEYLVRIYYTAQTFDQLRNLTPLTLEAPPATMQLRIPGARSASSLDVRFDVFQKLLRNAIGSKYVQEPSAEVPPGVLTGVPLK